MNHLVLVFAVGMLAAPDPAAMEARIPCLRGPFHRITATNELAEIVGPVDKHDWGCLGDRHRGAGGVQTLEPDGVPAPLPTAVCFTEAYPNPAAGQVVLRFTLPRATAASLVIYGRNGGGPKHVFVARTLLSGTYMAGMHQAVWDLRDDRGARVSPGFYRAVLGAEGEFLCGDIQVL